MTVVVWMTVDTRGILIMVFRELLRTGHHGILTLLTDIKWFLLMRMCCRGMTRGNPAFLLVGTVVSALGPALGGALVVTLATSPLPRGGTGATHTTTPPEEGGAGGAPTTTPPKGRVAGVIHITVVVGRHRRGLVGAVLGGILTTMRTLITLPVGGVGGGR